MASISKVQETKGGQRYWKISVSRGYGLSAYTTRFYWPNKKDGNPVAKRTAENELEKAVAEFERKCEAGEIENRAQRKKREEAEKAAEAEERAKLKTVRQYADGVFMPTKETTFSENARSSYRMFLDKHILPVLGDTLLTGVTPAMIHKLLLEFQKAGYAHASAVKVYNILNGIFEMAFLDDSIPMNPMLKVKRPTPRKDEPMKAESDKALTAKELAQVLEYVAQEPLKWQVYINLAADTGARRGELCGLQWDDIDWESGTVTIRRNLQYSSAKGVYVTSPKNGKIRVVDIGEDVLALLRQLRQEQATSCISKWCFTQDGSPEPMFPHSPTRYFKKFGERYGVKDFHPHKLRHTSASVILTNGGDVVSVSERLGHSDTAVTLRMYSHANVESIRKAGQTARDAVKKAQQG